jgi:3-hydroxyacyl-[acyl-carrier-protein] dehydratase
MRFFMIDRITTWEVGRVAEAVKNVALSEDFFDDHFPRRPIMPGVLMIEGMAQLAGLLIEATLQAKHAVDAKALLTVLERTKFREPVRPGDTLTYRAEVVSVNRDGGKATAQATCNGRVVATTGMVFVFKQVDDPLLAEKRASLMKIWMEPAPLARSER